MSDQDGAGPLEGVRVLELGTLLAGPFATRLLADFGAEVIKVELPGQGDPLRDWGRLRHNGRSLWWPIQSRNKKLITLNLRHPRGQELCRQLAAKSDVLVENFRPGTLGRWGLSAEVLESVNPRLIVAHVSGYGQTGPYSNRAGFASAGEAMGGLRYINGYPGQPPPRMGVSLGDSLAAMFATLGILMALYDRDANTGKGQAIDATILESCFALLEGIIPEFGKLGVVREPSGTVLEHVSPSNVYKTRDGKWVVIAANTDNLWERLCAVIGHPELLSDDRFATFWDRGNNMQILDDIIKDWVVERDAVDIDRVMNDAGIVCGPVYSIEDIFSDPHYEARNMLIEMEDPELGTLIAPGIIPKLSRTPGRARFTGDWQLGSHNTDVYAGLLGISDDELSSLRDDGVI